MLDKMKFWKDKDDDLDLDSELPPLDESGDGSDDLPGRSPGELKQETNRPDFKPENSLHKVHESQKPHAGGQGPFQQGSTGDTGRDLELINSKLDTIKAELDSMSQRIRKIERIAEGEKEEGSNKSRDPWSNF